MSSRRAEVGSRPLTDEEQTSTPSSPTGAWCHVWTAPGWQGPFHVCSLVGAAMCSACLGGSH